MKDEVSLMATDENDQSTRIILMSALFWIIFSLALIFLTLLLRVIYGS